MTDPARAVTARPYAPDPWLQAWGGLRARRIGLVVACVAFLALAWEPTGAGLVVGAGGLLAALHALRSWRCPRCGESFAGARGRWFALSCASCGLVEFAAPEFVAEPPGALAPDGQALSRRFRRFLAGSQVLGGILVLGIAIATRLPWLVGGVVEALGVASCLAGVWLWRDDARGYRYSRVLHALQLVKVQAGGVVYGVSAGFQILFWQSATGAGVEPGVAGNLALAVGASVPHLVAVNLFSLAALVLLLRARPGAAAVAHRGA
jgi:ribosomal protein S27AE